MKLVSTTFFILFVQFCYSYYCGGIYPIIKNDVNYDGWEVSVNSYVEVNNKKCLKIIFPGEVLIQRNLLSPLSSRFNLLQLNGYTDVKDYTSEKVLNGTITLLSKTVPFQLYQTNKNELFVQIDHSQYLNKIILSSEDSFILYLDEIKLLPNKITELNETCGLLPSGAISYFSFFIIVSCLLLM